MNDAKRYGKGMDIIKGVDYKTDGVMYFRGKVLEAEYQAIMRRLDLYIKSQGARKTGGMIVAIHVLYLETKVSDMDIYIPISREIPSISEFTYKPEFVLSNCVMSKFKGAPHLIPQAFTDIYHSAKSMGIDIKQPFYNVFAEEPDSFWHSAYTEMSIYAVIEG